MTMKKSLIAMACAIGFLLAQPASADGVRLDPFGLTVGQPIGINGVIICTDVEKGRKILGAYGASGIEAMQHTIDDAEECTVMAAFFVPRRVLSKEWGDAGTLRLIEVEMRAPEKHAGNTYYLLTMFPVFEKHALFEGDRWSASVYAASVLPSHVSLTYTW